MATIPRELSEDQLSSESETGSGPAAPRHLPQHGDQRGACEGFATSIAGTSTLLKGQSTGSALPQRSDAEATLISGGESNLRSPAASTPTEPASSSNLHEEAYVEFKQAATPALIRFQKQHKQLQIQQLRTTVGRRCIPSVAAE